MDWDRVRGQLAAVLLTSVTNRKLSNEQWTKAAANEGLSGKTCKSAVLDGQILFFVEQNGTSVLAFAVEGRELSGAERRLVELVVEGAREQEKSKPASPALDEERRARLVKEWFYSQLEAGSTHAEMPDALVGQLGLRSTKIPILLYGDYSDSLTVRYLELKKLLESFFGADVTVIPLMEKEWLILGSESLLEESDGDARDAGSEAGQLQDSLASICLGLHEMLSNEWVGECHLSIYYPIKPAKELIRTILLLREAIALGKTFDVVRNIHFPWKLQLEKLLNVVPDSERQMFVDRVLRGADHVLDTETLATLDHFFAFDCNVSETAKKLYIHRNTLLYRLDKFKNETGLDVRNFSDAVLVKVALLLYKVTKRK